VEVAAAAFGTVPADEVRLDGDTVADLHTIDVLAEGGDASAHLVSHHPWGMHPIRRPVVPVVEVDVGTTDRGRLHLENHLARSRGGLGHVGDDEAGPGSRLDDGLHASIMRSVRR